MTKEEYGNFALRYKGCGACFPMYHTLSRIEKMWFTAIQKDVAELEKENSKLKDKLEHRNCLDCSNHHSNIKLFKAKKIIKTFLGFAEAFGYSPSMDKFIAEAEQFLSEVEK